MFTHDDFTLFFSMPLNDNDWANLLTSKVSRVMLPSGVAHGNPKLLDGLSKHGIRTVIRLDNNLVAPADANLVQTTIREIMQHCQVQAVIIGNEFDVSFQMGYGQDWGTSQYAWLIRNSIDVARAALSGLGPLIISPAMAWRGFVETYPPMPGIVAWREIMAPVYNECQGNGVHIYSHAWWSYPAISQFLHEVRFWEGMRHQPIWIDEYNLGAGDNTTRMAACIGAAQTLLDTPALADRVEMFCPFVSNGIGNTYDPGLILTDPAAYQLLRRFMEGNDGHALSIEHGRAFLASQGAADPEPGTDTPVSPASPLKSLRRQLDGIQTG